MMKRSPRRISADAVARQLFDASVGAFDPIAAGQRVAAAGDPARRTRRRLARMLARIGSRKLISRTTPSPPSCAPLPPEPRRIANCVEPHRQPRLQDFGIGQPAVGHVGLNRARSRHGPGPAPDPPAIVS